MSTYYGKRDVFRETLIPLLQEINLLIAHGNPNSYNAVLALEALMAGYLDDDYRKAAHSINEEYKTLTQVSELKIRRNNVILGVNEKNDAKIRLAIQKYALLNGFLKDRGIHPLEEVEMLLDPSDPAYIVKDSEQDETNISNTND